LDFYIRFVLLLVPINRLPCVPPSNGYTTGSGSVLIAPRGSAGVLPSTFWDYANKALYFCTTTGDAATAGWSAVNASAATPAVPTPQGYLTLVSGTPVIPGDVASATTVFYTPDQGALAPIYSGSSFIPTEFTELSLSLAASHTLNTIYDVFVFSNSGVLTLVTGPAWLNSALGLVSHMSPVIWAVEKVGHLERVQSQAAIFEGGRLHPDVGRAGTSFAQHAANPSTASQFSPVLPKNSTICAAWNSGLAVLAVPATCS
jgi:hypothetical protein